MRERVSSAVLDGPGSRRANSLPSPTRYVESTWGFPTVPRKCTPSESLFKAEASLRDVEIYLLQLPKRRFK